MAQLTLDIPDEIEARLRSEAQEAGVSVEQYVLNKITCFIRPWWPHGYLEGIRFTLSEDFKEPEDLPPDPVEAIDVFK